MSAQSEKLFRREIYFTIEQLNWLDLEVARRRGVARHGPQNRGTIIRAMVDLERAHDQEAPIGPQLLVARGMRPRRMIAKRSGLSEQAIAKIESPDGNPQLESLQALSRALGSTS